MTNKAKMGRPLELGYDLVSKRLEMPRALFDAASDVSEKEGKSLSRWIRDAMVQSLDTRKGKA